MLTPQTQEGSVIDSSRRKERSLQSEPKFQLFKKFIMKLKDLLTKADVTELRPRSVLATSRAEYVYQNNATQIQWLNDQLEGELVRIFNEDDNIQQISEAFSASVLFKKVSSPVPQIMSIMDLQPFINCSFNNYTAEVIDGRWQCVGPCMKELDYCNGHGQCLNDINVGAVCNCYSSKISKYFGPRCQHFRWGPAFYGALFGSIAAALLMAAVVAIVVFLVKQRRCGSWNRAVSTGFLDFDEDYFDFTGTGRYNLGLAGSYTAERFRPYLENIDT
nr:uncharacterized protein LOC133604776 [Nerophis lumbriciformis]